MAIGVFVMSASSFKCHKHYLEIAFESRESPSCNLAKAEASDWLIKFPKLVLVVFSGATKNRQRKPNHQLSFILIVFNLNT